MTGKFTEHFHFSISWQFRWCCRLIELKLTIEWERYPNWFWHLYGTPAREIVKALSQMASSWSRFRYQASQSHSTKQQTTENIFYPPPLPEVNPTVHCVPSCCFAWSQDSNHFPMTRRSLLLFQCWLVQTLQDSRLLYYLIREIKMWLNSNHITVPNNTYFIF